MVPEGGEECWQLKIFLPLTSGGTHVQKRRWFVRKNFSHLPLNNDSIYDVHFFPCAKYAKKIFILQFKKNHLCLSCNVGYLQTSAGSKKLLHQSCYWYNQRSLLPGSCYKNCSEDPVLLHLLVLARGSFYMASIVFAAVCNNCGSMAVDKLLFCWGPHAGLHVGGAWPGTTILQGGERGKGGPLQTGWRRPPIMGTPSLTLLPAGSCRGRQWKGDSSKGSRSKILKESGDNAGTISIVMTGSIVEVAIRTPNMWSKFLRARGWKKGVLDFHAWKMFLNQFNFQEIEGKMGMTFWKGERGHCSASLSWSFYLRVQPGELQPFVWTSTQSYVCGAGRV